MILFWDKAEKVRQAMLFFQAVIKILSGTRAWYVQSPRKPAKSALLWIVYMY